MVEIVAVGQSILECKSLVEIENICTMCKNPATVVASHSSLLEEIQSDNTENSTEVPKEFNMNHQ